MHVCRRAYVFAAHCPLTCARTHENMKHCSFVCTDVALTTSEAPETVQLLHTDSHLGRVWLRLRCEHVHTHTHTHTHTVNPLTHPYIQKAFPLSPPKNAYLSDVQLFLYRGLVVARDPLFQFCKIWTDSMEKRGAFPVEWGWINTPTSLSFPLFFLFSFFFFFFLSYLYSSISVCLLRRGWPTWRRISGAVQAGLTHTHTHTCTHTHSSQTAIRYSSLYRITVALFLHWGDFERVLNFVKAISPYLITLFWTCSYPRVLNTRCLKY